MGIQLGSNFDMQAGLPLDSRLVVPLLATRDAIPAGIRYEGMEVYVTNEQKKYILKGGITNANWEESGGSGNAFDETVVFFAGLAKYGHSYVWSVGAGEEIEVTDKAKIVISGECPFLGSVFNDSSNELEVTIVNNTIGPIVFRNEDTSVADVNERILTGTGADFSLPVGAAVDLVYVAQSVDRWVLKGALGGASSSTLVPVKSGVITAATFTGTAPAPRTATVTFSTPFTSNYAVTLTGSDARLLSITSKTTAAFTVSTNSNTALTGDVFWTAMQIGEGDGLQGPQGSMDVGVEHAYTAQQYVVQTSLTDAATVSWDLSTNQVTSVTLAGSRALANPTNMRNGATYVLFVKQDATGGRTLTYGSNFKWPSGTAPVLSTAANATDILSFISDGTYMYGGSIQKGYA